MSNASVKGGKGLLRCHCEEAEGRRSNLITLISDCFASLAMTTLLLSAEYPMSVIARLTATPFGSQQAPSAEAISTEVEQVADVLNGIYGNVRDEDGVHIDNVDVSIFDGFVIHDVKTDKQGIYKIPEISVSPGNYAVLFFIKKAYIPKIANIKVEEKKAVEYSTVIERLDVKNTGFVIGTVYQPIRGGKIQFQSGIYSFGKNRRVWLEKDREVIEKVIEKRTDINGHFLFEVPTGIYRLSGEGIRENVEVEVSEGQIVIKNLRAGLVLVD